MKKSLTQTANAIKKRSEPQLPERLSLEILEREVDIALSESTKRLRDIVQSGEPMEVVSASNALVNIGKLVALRRNREHEEQERIHVHIERDMAIENTVTEVLE